MSTVAKVRKREITLETPAKKQRTSVSQTSIVNDKIGPEGDLKVYEKELLTQTALLIVHFDHPFVVDKNFPVPKLSDYEILVENKSVGLNPIDWKGKKYKFGIYHFPWLNGRESSGKVVKKGTKVEGLKCGDRIAISSTSYRDNRTSTFQQYTAVDSRLIWKLPLHITFESGATLGVGLVAASILLYESFGFGLSQDYTNEGTMVIWGGGTAVGLYIAQLAKIHGVRVISIASLDNEQYLKSMGANVVIDRSLPPKDIEKKLSDLCPQGIQFGVDCHSKATATTLVEFLDKISDKTGKPSLFTGLVGVPKAFPDNVEYKQFIIKKFHENISLGERVIHLTSHFLRKGLIRPLRSKSYSGDLEMIDTALKDLEEKGAKSEKYVINLSQTS